MIVELCISKDRVPYIVEALGKENVVVEDYKEDQDLLRFDLNNPLDVLRVFHAGIRHGSDSMRNALCK